MVDVDSLLKKANKIWIISKLVVVKQGKMVNVLKQNGHPVSLKGISFICGLPIAYLFTSISCVSL